MPLHPPWQLGASLQTEVISKTDCLVISSYSNSGWNSNSNSTDHPPGYCWLTPQLHTTTHFIRNISKAHRTWPARNQALCRTEQ